MAFDVEGALAAGYSRSDIADYLASQKNFDVSGARKAGYSDDDILTHLLPEKPLAKTVAPAAPKITTVENPLSAKEPGLIDRAVTAIKGLTSPSSVMEGYTPTPEQQQKSVDQRLALGQGPISETAVSKGQDIRAGRLKTEDEGLKRVARALQQQQAPTLEGVVSEVEPYIDRGYQAGEFGGDVSKQFGGAAVGGTLKIPSGIETGLRGLVRNVLSGDALTATPAGRLITTAQTALADTFGLRSVAEQTADKEAAKVTIDRALSGIPTIPGTAELAQYGDRVQKDIQNSISITGKKLIAGSTPSGNIFKGELSFGDDPTLSGYALQASSVLGSLAPVIATIVATGSPTAAAGVGGGMAAGEAADAARTYISKLTDAQLQETSPYYQTLIKRGVPPQEARTIITDKAAENGAMLQGMVAAVGDRITGKFLTGAYNDILSRVGGKTVLGRVGVGIAGGAAEEGTQELFEGLASDIGIRSQIANKEIGEDSAANLILGALGGAGPGAYQGARTPVTPEQEIANIINANVANMQPVGTREAAVAALSPEFADSNVLAQGILRSATVDDAIAAADQAAGSITAPSFVPPAIAPAEPIIPIAPVAEIQQPLINLGRIEPTLLPVTEPTSVTLPEIRSDLPILAPRPQRIQGQPVANLTDNQLSSVVEDQTLPAITRRGAQIELDARRTEQRTGRVEPTLEPFAPPAAEPMGGRVEPTLEPFAPPGAPAAPLPTTAAEPVAGAIDTAAIRADAQRYADEQAAAENRPSSVQLNPAPAVEQQAVEDIAQALGSQFGTKIEAYSDPRDVAVNGFAFKGAAFVNVANVPMNITRTTLHEFKHTVEQIAQAETQAGLTGTPAQQFVADIDSIFDDITEEGRQAYAENFLFEEELKGLTGTKRQKRLRQLMTSSTLRSEMTADFLGNRAVDKAFWQDLATQDPEGFKGFVEKWLKIVDELLATLRGTKTQGRKESAKVDKYIRDLNVAKMVARDALIDYRRGTLVQTEKAAAAGKPAASLREGEGREENIPAGGEGVLPSTEGAGPSAGELGRGEIPSYGKGREGAVSVIGRHYSPRVQTSLSGRYYGTGIRGAEGSRIRESKDRRIGDRIYFYVDTGSGIRPESGVGRFAHEVRLNNIYDTSTGLIPPQGSANAFESAVIDAGFDGYMAPFGRGAAVVLLGPKHDAVPVKPLEPGVAYAKRQKVEEPEAAEAEVKPKVQPTKFKEIADSLGLSEPQYRATVLGLMTGQTKSKTFETPLVGGIPEVVQWLDTRYAEAGMDPLDLKNAEDRTVLAKMLAAEAVAAIKSAGTAVEWYDDTVRKTLQIMAVKYPELNTDDNARNAFLMAVAISSQTMNVEDNLRYASNQYESFRETGQYPEVGTGKSAPAMGKNFALANSLLKEMGPDLLRRFLQTEFTKRELESIGFSIGGESMDEAMLGSAVFGPKIGFGFYSNLSGNFEPVTMDMWFMRTVGRLTGKLPAFEEKLFNQQVFKLRNALLEEGDSGTGVYAADFDQALVDEAKKSDEGAIALARAVYSLHNRQFIKERAKFDSGERKKTKLVSAATAILKSADKPKDSPSSGGERQRLRDVVRKMVDLVEKETGKRVPPAALQALIWYPEQELYKKLGVKLRVTSQDYAGAAESLLTKEGFDGKRIRAAAESRPRPAQPVAGGEVARPTRKARAEGKVTGPLKGEEREAFVGPRVAERLKEEAEALPLVDVFTGLQKRGLPKTNMEAKVGRRDDAARIKYVQDNFLDILSELEDSGKVKINCD